MAGLAILGPALTLGSLPRAPRRPLKPWPCAPHPCLSVAAPWPCVPSLRATCPDRLRHPGPTPTHAWSSPRPSARHWLPEPRALWAVVAVAAPAGAVVVPDRSHARLWPRPPMPWLCLTGAPPAMAAPARVAPAVFFLSVILLEERRRARDKTNERGPFLRVNQAIPIKLPLYGSEAAMFAKLFYDGS